MKSKVLILLLIGFFAFSCAQDDGGSQDSGSSASPAGFPLTYDTYNGESVRISVTVDQPPQRIIATNQSSLEILLALGIADNVVGWAWPDNQRWPEYEDLYDQVPLLSDKYPANEIVLGARPEFVIGWKSYFSRNMSCEVLNEKGIATYIRLNSGIDIPERTMENEFSDILAIGNICGVSDRAQSIVDEMQEQMAGVKEILSKVPGEDRPVVIAAAVWSDSRYTIYGPGELIADMAVRAGGVYHPQVNTRLTEVSKETFLELDPDVIIYSYMSASGAPEDSYRGYFIEDPVLRNLTASKQERFIPVPLTQNYASGVLTIHGFERIAKGLWPELN